jgi:hypothetical protein
MGASTFWNSEGLSRPVMGLLYLDRNNKTSDFHLYGPGSSIGIATDYGLSGPGIESRWGEIFRPSRLALGPTQPPVQWVPGLSRG